MPPRCVHWWYHRTIFWSWTTCCWRNRRLFWLELMPPWCCCEYHRIRYGFRWPFCGPQEGCVWLLNGSAMVLREYCNFVNNYVKLIIFSFFQRPWTLYLLFCFVTDSWFCFSWDVSWWPLLLFVALKRPALGFGHFVFALGGVNTYSSFIKIFEDFSNLKIWIRVDFVGWALGIATILAIYKVCTKFLCYLL